MARVLVFPEEFRSDDVTAEVVTREDPFNDVTAIEEVAGEEPCDKVVATCTLLTVDRVERGTVDEDPFNGVTAMEEVPGEEPCDDVVLTLLTADWVERGTVGDPFNDVTAAEVVCADATTTSLAESDEADWLDDVSDDVSGELRLCSGCFLSFPSSFSSDDDDGLFATFLATALSLSA